MGESRQCHPSLKISRIKGLPKGDFVAVGDSMQDLIILQTESKVKAALGKNVKISLPKAFQTSKEQTRSLAVKQVLTDIALLKFLYGQSVRFPAFFLFSSFKAPFFAPFFCPYKSRINRAKTVLTSIWLLLLFLRI